ncbi:MAG: hypothetical protein O9267_09795 [Flavobacterium sp.]|uniref:hypothetical protein n=1 Tax=Flavobacterium sp. TaxID=239 RepID=UPI0022C66AC8|nr:hypothetical protein [Flavobacterium sp.]MCZ8197886.1 hypothetical protein [Flavobacterium sp.]
MKKLNLTQLTNEELQIEAKKRKINYQTAAFIVGMMIGVAVWSAIKNGFGILLFTPLLFAYWFRNAKPEYDEVKKEIQSRNLKL